MIPLYSDRPLSRIPFVTVLLIIVNTAVFWFQLTGQGSVQKSIILYGMIPSDIFNPGEVTINGRIPAVLTLITSISPATRQL